MRRRDCRCYRSEDSQHNKHDAQFSDSTAFPGPDGTLGHRHRLIVDSRRGSESVCGLGSTGNTGPADAVKERGNDDRLFTDCRLRQHRTSLLPDWSLHVLSPPLLPVFSLACRRLHWTRDVRRRRLGVWVRLVAVCTLHPDSRIVRSFPHLVNHLLEKTILICDKIQ